jgi:hypothetical protein
LKIICENLFIKENRKSAFFIIARYKKTPTC